MGYVYGLLLIITIFLQLKRDKTILTIIVKKLLPSAIIGAALLGVLSAIYGFVNVIKTQFPLSAGLAYKANNFGFWGVGRDFWNPTNVNIKYYIGSPSGFWILGSLVLIIATLTSLISMFRRKSRVSEVSTADEVVICCCVMHLAFVFLFFGNAWSWGYYVYILVLGITAIAVRSSMTNIMRIVPVALVALMSMLGCYTGAIAAYTSFNTKTTSSATAGLFASAALQREVAETKRLAVGHSATVLSMSGYPRFMGPEFGEPTTFFLTYGANQEVEISRKVNQMIHSDLIIIPREEPGMDRNKLEQWHEFQSILKNRESP